jgi:hypothetical protein
MFKINVANAIINIKTSYVDMAVPPLWWEGIWPNRPLCSVRKTVYHIILSDSIKVYAAFGRFFHTQNYKDGDTMATLWAGHFDYTEEHPRELLAEQWAQYIRAWLGNGVRNGGQNLQVTAAGGLKLRMDAGENVNDVGYANIEGYIFSCAHDSISGRYFEMEAPAAHPTYGRIDRYVLRLDRTIQVLDIYPTIITGIASGSPAPPELTVSVKPNAT